MQQLIYLRILHSRFHNSFISATAIFIVHMRMINFATLIVMTCSKHIHTQNLWSDYLRLISWVGICSKPWMSPGRPLGQTSCQHELFQRSARPIAMIRNDTMQCRHGHIEIFDSMPCWKNLWGAPPTGPRAWGLQGDTPAPEGIQYQYWITLYSRNKIR